MRDVDSFIPLFSHGTNNHGPCARQCAGYGVSELNMDMDNTVWREKQTVNNEHVDTDGITV